MKIGFLICTGLFIAYLVFSLVLKILYKRHEFDINYYKISGNYRNKHLSKGEWGEFCICEELNKIREKKYAYCNLYYIGDKYSTEVDIAFVYKGGIYVIESKNYQGKIIGKVDEKEWIQKFNRREKRTFYSPVMQNNTHVKRVYNDLKLWNKEKDFPIYSLIIFPNDVKLKIDKKKFGNTAICKWKDVKNIISKNESKLSAKRYLTDEEIEEIASRFKEKTMVSTEDKIRHIHYANEQSARFSY